MYIIQSILGHKDINTSSRYAHLNPGYKKEQAEKMGHFFESPMHSACTLDEGKMFRKKTLEWILKFALSLIGMLIDLMTTKKDEKKEKKKEG